MINQLKANLAQAQCRMKKYADTHRSERSFSVGDMVYLKMQPYRMAAFGIRHSLKLTSKYYGPFRILKKIGPVAYELQLPATTSIHPVFHVSQLKKHIGPRAILNPDLPMVNAEGRIKTEPVAVLETRALPRQGNLITQWLMQWQNLPPENSIWEDADFIQHTFPQFYYDTIKSWFPDSAIPTP
uniref:Tf2-1-like SH3-like domain-containing protein n=1 Tax=Arundo donax TaxID=35708 RepID=A0A0A9GL08_ARUDO